MLRVRVCVVLLVVGLALVANTAAQPLTIEKVLDNWAAALGGRDKLAAVQTSHSHAALKTSGLTGTMDEYWSADDRSAYYLSLANGAVKISGGCNGDSCWQKDMNGQTRPLSGIDLTGAITGRFLAHNAQFFPERRPGKVELGKTANSGEIAVEISPTGGKPVTYFLDASTFLPLRSETQGDDRKEMTWYGDWRDVDGMKVAHEVRQGTGDSLRDMFFSTQTVEINVKLDDSVFLSPTARARDYSFTAGSQAKDIPFELISNHIYVPVQVNGSRKLWFIFDTGAEMSCINKRIADELGLSSSGDLEGRGGGEKSVSVSLAQGITYELPGVKVANQIAAVISFDQLEPIAGHVIDGVLGYDFLSRFVVEIKYDQKLLTLTEPSTYTYGGAAQPLTFEMRKSLPIVSVEVTVAGCPPVKGRFLMDTGMSGALTLTSPAVKANNLTACAAKAVAAPHELGVGGQSKIKITRAASVKIGTHSVDNLVIGLSEDTLGANASTEQDGTFGGEILRRFAVTFDYLRHQLFLEPNADFATPHEYDMSGLRLRLGENMKDEVSIMGVLPESPAEKAGLQVGDIIVKVNDQSIAGKPLWDVRQEFKTGPQAKVKVTYIRGGSTKDATVTLDRLI